MLQSWQTIIHWLLGSWGTKSTPYFLSKLWWGSNLTSLDNTISISPPHTSLPLQANSHSEAQQKARFWFSTLTDNNSKRKALVLKLWKHSLLNEVSLHSFVSKWVYFPLLSPGWAPGLHRILLSLNFQIFAKVKHTKGGGVRDNPMADFWVWGGAQSWHRNSFFMILYALAICLFNLNL